ncbi:MAG: hypothetical protein SVU32_02800, partial [Candidatus Nanohaloarchaea archaeon]|nr:hypothetical protein [Candidatus Nanohaloarchaea archaeon]
REQTIDRLPFNPVDRTFSLSAPQDLQQYTLRVVLGKGDTVYDTFTASYEPLTVERKLTASGQVKKAGACFTDGVCTQEEYEIGSCYDCIGVETPPGQQPGQQKKTGGIPQGVIVIAFLIAGIVAGVVIYRQVV